MAERRYYQTNDSYDRNRNPESRRMKFIPGSAILAIALVITMRLIYGFRVCPVLPVGDAGELATAAYTNGIAHPPGYPLFTILGRIFTHYSFRSPDTAFPQEIFDVAFRMNMMSLWLGVLTVLVLYFILARALKNPIVAFLGAFVFGTSSTFMSQCLVGEVYTLNALITALIIFVLLLIDDRPTSWRLVVLALLFGLGVAHHTSVLLLALPAIFFLILTLKAKRIAVRRGILIGMAIFFLIGLLPYLYLPSASAKDPYLDWGNPESFGNFFKVVTRSDYRDIKMEIEGDTLGFSGIASAFRDWQHNSFGTLFIIAGYIGLLICIFKARRYGLMLGLFYFFVTVPYFMYFGNITQIDLFFMDVYYIPAHLVFAIFIAYTFAWLIEKLPRIFSKPGPRFLLGVVVCIALIVLIRNFYIANGSKITMVDHTIGSRYSYDVLDLLPQNAILITGEDEVFLFWYLQQVAEMRKDVVVLEAMALPLTKSWWWNSIRNEYPDLVVPEILDNDEKVSNGQFLEYLRHLNPNRKIYLTSFYEEFMPTADGRSYVPDGVLFEYGMTSSFKSPFELETPLANNLFTGELDFSVENLDPYEYRILEHYAYAFYNYGIYFIQAKQNNLARELLMRSFTLDPGFDPGGSLMPTAGILARAYLKESDYVSAHDVLSTLIAHQSADSVWYYLDAFSLIKLQKFDEARLVVLEGLKKDETNQFLKSLMIYLSRPVNELLDPGTQPVDNIDEVFD